LQHSIHQFSSNFVAASVAVTITVAAAVAGVMSDTVVDAAAAAAVSSCDAGSGDAASRALCLFVRRQLCHVLKAAKRLL
jgi:hypothetical protein